MCSTTSGVFLFGHIVHVFLNPFPSVRGRVGCIAFVANWLFGGDIRVRFRAPLLGLCCVVLTVVAVVMGGGQFFIDGRVASVCLIPCYSIWWFLIFLMNILFHFGTLS